MSQDLERLRPYRELDPLAQRVLAASFRFVLARGDACPGAQLRYETQASRRDLARLIERRLLSQQSGLDAFLPTVEGLLYLPEADHILTALDRLLRLAAARYRPDAIALEEAEILSETGLERSTLHSATHFGPELGLDLAVFRRRPDDVPLAKLTPTEAALESDSLAAAIARRAPVPSQPPPDAGLPAFRVRARRLRLRNFRVLRHLDLPLSNVTALVGANGSGKSTVLDALAFFTTAMRYGLDQAVRDQGGLERLRSSGATGATEHCRYRAYPPPESRAVSRLANQPATSQIGGARLWFRPRAPRPLHLGRPAPRGPAERAYETRSRQAANQPSFMSAARRRGSPAQFRHR